MQNVSSPFRRVMIAGALVGALSLSSLAVVAAQDGVTPADATAEAEAQGGPGFLGVRISTVDGAVVVDSVLSGSPAERSGIQAGDVITEVNGVAVTEAAEVSIAVSTLVAGDTVELTLTRGDETISVSAVLAAANDFATAGGGPFRRFDQFMLEGLGLSYDPDSQTLTINELSEDSALYAAGLRAGDQITAVDGQPLDPAALMGHLAEVGQDSSLTLTVLREGETLEVTVPVADLMLAGMAGHGMLEGMLPCGQMLPNGAMPGLGQIYGFGGHGVGGYLGLSFVTLNEEVAADNGVELTEGALVKEVAADSPAAEAGLVAGDVITAVNGDTVDEERTLRDRVSAFEEGDVVTLTVVRAGAEQQIDVTLGQPVAMFGQMMMPFGRGMHGFHGQGGFGFRGGMPGQGGVLPEMMPTAVPPASGVGA